jgi:RNA polymerase sigma-B factor
MTIAVISRPHRRGRGPRRVKSLLRRWHVAGERAAREALVEEFMPLARSLARRYARSSEPDEELARVAGEALTHAIDRFDSDDDSSFESFAIPAILGELRQHVADSAWSAQVARTAHERLLAVTDATERLTELNGRAPTVDDLATYLELGTEQILDALDVGHVYETEPLDAPHLLPEREQEILRMRFVEGMQQSEIAAGLGVAQVQVSRSLRCALELLRREMTVGSVI